jgi:homoserine O-succinyltransferase
MIEIGLVYNLPISAFPATERRYRHVLEKAAGKIPFRLRFFSLSSTGPLPDAAKCVRNIGADLRGLDCLNIDGLIVTGAEPRASSLPKESYWGALTELVDWAEVNTHSTIWSCLAAHAAVLHLDGIERRKLAQKCSGMYNCSKVNDSWLTDGLRSPLRVSHSRWHELDELGLRDRGYQVLTKSKDAGIDIFTKRQGSQFFSFRATRNTTVCRSGANIYATLADISPATRSSTRTFRSDISTPKPPWRLGNLGHGH